MSLFKVKEWWSNNKVLESTPPPGIQGAGCLKVDRFQSHTDSDCILIAEEYILKIYKPTIGNDLSDLLLEVQLDNVILHIETGKFIGVTDDRQIIILHPLCYCIYQLEKKEGHTNAGDQNSLKLVIKHQFTRKSYTLVCGPFGNMKTRDLICIQALDGSLSFFDQETFLFMCIFNDVIIPGPVCYIASCDSFVIGKSTWILEIYSYQQLREFSEVSLRQNKKNIPQWIYNAGEEVTLVQAVQTSTNFSTVLALGERYLYCFQDNGLMKYMLKFDYMPICFYAYLIGWYYEPNSRLLVMVVSEDAKLYVYESTTLLWSCDLLENTIAITRCFIKSLPGGIVTLSSKGVVTISYLGTEPDLNCNTAPVMNDVVDPKQVQTELEAVEEELQRILDYNGGDDQTSEVVQTIKIKADVGKPTQNLFQEYLNENQEALHLIMCPVVVILSCENPQIVQNIQITYVCYSPFTCSESTISLDNVNATEIIESQVFLSNDAEISEMKVEILFTITDNVGKIVVLSKIILLPLSLYCTPTKTETGKSMKINIHTNRPNVHFGKIFTDFSIEELCNAENAEDITMVYRSTKKTVTIRAQDGHYIFEADDFPEMRALLEHFIINLTDHFRRMDDKDFKLEIIVNRDLFKQILFKFLKYVEYHAKERTTLKSFEDELNILQKQFTVIQKRLLVQYGSLPPGNCDSLEFLMQDTHERIVNCVSEIIKCRKIIRSAGSLLTTMGRLIIYIFDQTSLESFKVKLVAETLCLESLYDDYQEWEEAVTQSLSYIVNKIFNNTEKDKEKLAPVTEQGILSHINLKRFMKQLRLVLEKLYTEAYEGDTHGKNENKENSITRIEEFVEVL
ncbi:hypothetical protein ACJJTC_008443 [Scirpophaga incertulas]